MWPIRFIASAISKNLTAHPGIGVCPLTQRLGVLLSTSAIAQKSDCFQPRRFNEALNSSGVIHLLAAYDAMNKIYHAFFFLCVVLRTLYTQNEKITECAVDTL